MKQPVVYIMANKRNGTLYVGVTSNLQQRVTQHKNKQIVGFTSRYNCTLLVYIESFATMLDAIVREKQIKGLSREKKILLIESLNMRWRDLYEELFLNDEKVL